MHLTEPLLQTSRFMILQSHLDFNGLSSGSAYHLSVEGDANRTRSTDIGFHRILVCFGADYGFDTNLNGRESISGQPGATGNSCSSLWIFLLFSASNWYDEVCVGVVVESQQDADSSFPLAHSWLLIMRPPVLAQE
jgi:hypothetical protein